jgi:RNA polymerase sigma-70 factor (ECF subfamily)
MGTITYSVGTAIANPYIKDEHKDASLIRQILTGRQDLLGDLIKPHIEPLRRCVRGKMGNDPDVEDIVQQTVFKAFAHLDQFRFEACFRTWLVRIALNEIAQSWRRRVPGRVIGLEDSGQTILQTTDPGDSPLRSYERGQTTKLLQRAVNSLPEKYRVVVRMRDLEERSISEVAEALCLSIGAVKSRHHRGRSRMVQILTRPRKVIPPSGEQTCHL